MYDAEQVLRSIDDHTVLVLLIAGGALVGMTIWLGEGYRNAKRDQTYPLPVVCTMYWLVHDGHYAAHADTWFSDYDHWFPQLFWVALTCTATFEAACVWRIYRYGRADLAPTIDHRLWGPVVLGTVGVSLVAWVMVKDVIDDSLYIVTNGLAVLSFGVFGLARLLRNGSMRGQSMLMWQGFTLCAVCWFLVTGTLFGDSFHDWRWYLVGVASVACGVTGIVATHRLASQEPARTAIGAPPGDSETLRTS